MKSKKSNKILVIGSTVADLVAQTEELPIPGQTIFGKKFFVAPGGKGANQAVTIARLGGEVIFISKVGKDYFGDYVLKFISDSNVDISYIIRDSVNHSGVSLITLLENGLNAIVMTPGSNMAFEVEEIKRIEHLFREASVFLTQLEIPIPVVEYSLFKAKQNGCITILDPAPARKLSDEILKLADIVTPNEIELEILTGMKLERILVYQ